MTASGLNTLKFYCRQWKVDIAYSVWMMYIWFSIQFILSKSHFSVGHKHHGRDSFYLQCFNFKLGGTWRQFTSQQLNFLGKPTKFVVYIKDLQLIGLANCIFVQWDFDMFGSLDSTLDCVVLLACSLQVALPSQTFFVCSFCSKILGQHHVFLS